MRRSLSAFAALMLVASLVGIAPGAAAQLASPYGMASGGTAATVRSAPPGAPVVLRRAAAFVAMAQSAPAAAPSVRANREAGVAAAAAAAAYATAVANYDAGFQFAADSAARQAIAFADAALAAVLVRPSPLVQTAAGGDVALVPSVTSPAPLVMTTTGVLRLPTSYSQVTRLPFGATLAGPGAPPLPDSLPFGAVPVAPNPSLVAP